MIFLLPFVIVKFVTASPQFPNHMDFEKIGEVKLSNVKYNILRPTTHFVKDAFEDFALRRDSSDFPTKRVFMDDNGMRHYWTGLEEKLESLRKARDSRKDLKGDEVEATETYNDTSTIVITETDKDLEEVTTTNTNEETKVTRKQPRRKKKVTDAPIIHHPTDTILRDGSERTIAKTTFFCPFFGVITMQSYLDGK